MDEALLLTVCHEKFSTPNGMAWCPFIASPRVASLTVQACAHESDMVRSHPHMASSKQHLALCIGQKALAGRGRDGHACR